MGKDSKDKGKPDGHHIGKAHKSGGKGSWDYVRDNEDEPGMHGEDLPKGVRHGDVTDDKK